MRRLVPLPLLRFLKVRLLIVGLLFTGMQAQTGAIADLLNGGTAAVRRGDLAGAEVLFRRATEQAPTLSDTFLGLGLVQLRRGELDGAIGSLRRATELNAQLTGAHLYLGIAQYQAAEAQGSLRQELALSPSSAEALRWLGIVELALGHPEQAVEPLDRLAMLRPGDPEILYYQAKAHQAFAKDALGKLYALDPDSFLVHRALGEMMDDSGDAEKAVTEFKAALRKDPNNGDLLEELGDADQKLSRFDEATAAYQKELATNPNSAIALYDLGKIDVERGRPDEGVPLLRRAQSAHASPAPTDFYLGLGLEETNHSEEAAHWLEEALAHQPSDFIRRGVWFQLARVYRKLNRLEDASHALAELKQVQDQQAQAPGPGPGPGSSEAQRPVQPPERE